MEYDDDQIKMLNGRYLMRAIASLNYEATENELFRHITATGHSQNLVREELKRILDYGVSNGFIMKNHDKYLIPRLVDVHQVDGSECVAVDESVEEPVKQPEETRKRSVAIGDKGMTFSVEETEEGSSEVTIKTSFLEAAKSIFCRGLPNVLTAEKYPSECLEGQESYDSEEEEEGQESNDSEEEE